MWRSLMKGSSSLSSSLLAGRRVISIFTRDDGNAWRASHQKRRLEEACARAADRSARDVPYPAAYIRQRSSRARRPNGRYRGTARPRRYAHD